MDDKPKSPEVPLEPLEDAKAQKTESSQYPTPKPAESGENNTAPALTNPKPKTPLRQRLKDSANLYLIFFLLLVISVLIAIAVLFNLHKKNNSNNKGVDSLTSQQLAQLQGNTTLVGDSKQTLDIQSNTVLEGQLLVRKDLNVAGSLKVGGGLSLSSVTVGGQGNFGQLQINGTLSVSGNTTFSGLLNVQKNLTVAGSGTFGGSLSAARLSVTSLQLNGDLQINRHITLGGSLPGKTNGGALGAGGTASVNGTDTAGTITINTGASPAAGNLITINFAAKFNSTPHVVVTPVGSAAASLQYYISRSTTSFTLSTANAPPAGSSFSFDYIVID